MPRTTRITNPAPGNREVDARPSESALEDRCFSARGQSGEGSVVLSKAGEGLGKQSCVGWKPERPGSPPKHEVFPGQSRPPNDRSALELLAFWYFQQLVVLKNP